MLGDFVRRWVGAGLGLAMLTKDKAEALVRDLVQQGQVSAAEGRDLLDTLLHRAELEREELRARIGQEIRRVLATAGVPSREEVAALSRRLDALEARLEGAGGGTGKAPGSGDNGSHG